MHDKEPTIWLKGPSGKRLFCFGIGTQGLDTETLPKLEIRLSTSPLTPLISFKVSDLSGFGLVFQFLITGIRTATCEETERTADVASEPARVVAAGGRVIGGKTSPPVITGSAMVTPD